jgi:membrane protease YdiL (CAAX protease family)
MLEAHAATSVLTASVAGLATLCVHTLLLTLRLQDIDRDTQLFVLQLFGAKRDVWGVVPAAAVMSLAAAVCEETLFRGVLQQYGADYIGAVPALIVTSLLFGLAHNPVPGTVYAKHIALLRLLYLQCFNRSALLQCLSAYASSAAALMHSSAC